MNQSFTFLKMAAAIALFSASACTAKTSDFKSNDIKQGFADVYIDVVAEDVAIPMDSLTAGVFWTPLLDYNAVDRVNKIVSPAYNRGNHIRVPMETLRRDGVVLSLYSTADSLAANDMINRIMTLNVGLSQEEPLRLKLYFNGQGDFLRLEHSGGTGYVDTTNQYGKILSRYGSTEITNKEDWEDYNRFLKWQTESMYPSNMKEAFEGVELQGDLKEFIKSDITRNYFTSRVLGYVDMAKTFGRDFCGVDTAKIQEPPLEFYSFLNNLDYSPAMLNDFSHGLRRMCNNMLRYLHIPEIGETPVDQWQSEAKATLNKVISNPPQMLVDLLTATSYMQQIQAKQQPLTPTQISNINAFYKDSDLGKIIISRNSNPYPNCPDIY